MRQLVSRFCCCAAAIASLLVPGCDRGSGNTGVAVIHDSAGVTFITNAEVGAWGDTPRWTVSDSAEVRIGAVEGNPAHELRLAVGAVRMPDGRIIVANRGSSELRIHDSEGRHLQSAGRDGEGPGEFRNIGNLWRYRADSLAVYDRSLRRLSIFDSRPAFARSVTLTSPGNGAAPAVVDVLPDGTLLVVGSAAITPTLGTGIHRRPGPVLRYTSNGAVVDTITSVLGEEWVGIDGANGPVLSRRPFGRNSFVAGVGNSIAVADAERFEVLFYSAEGRLLRKVMRSSSNRPVTADERQRFEDLRVEATRTEEAAIRTREMLNRMPIPTTHPAFLGMLVDIEGNIWLEDPQVTDNGDRGYNVLDDDGQFLGRVAMPDGLRPLEIGTDYVLGRFVDEIGVEFIQLHELNK